MTRSIARVLFNRALNGNPSFNGFRTHFAPHAHDTTFMISKVSCQSFSFTAFNFCPGASFARKNRENRVE
jgi:hypothetical protein